MNKTILKGRLTRDPELRFAAGTGTAIVKFSLAVPKRYKRDEANFINCVGFGKRAETIAQHFVKGQEIFVIGELTTNTYEKEGVKKYSTEVNIEEFEFCGSKPNGQGGGNNAGNYNNSNNSNNSNGNQYNQSQPQDNQFGGGDSTFGMNNFGMNNELNGDMMPIDDGDIPF